MAGEAGHRTAGGAAQAIERTHASKGKTPAEPATEIQVRRARREKRRKKARGRQRWQDHFSLPAIPGAVGHEGTDAKEQITDAGV
jgi:hypothetical protein